jgi:DNA-binding cell septation regulator SpoVG
MKYQVKIRKVFDTDKPVKALASVTIENKIAIHGVRVVETEKGRFHGRCRWLVRSPRQRREGRARRSLARHVSAR